MVKIIAFEGIDACGKETQAQMLVGWLQKQKYDVLPEAFPRYQEPIGALIKQWLNQEVDLTHEAVHMLYEADRQDYMDTVNWIESTTSCDYIVLDRYKMSNLAFGGAKGIDYFWLIGIQSKVRNADLTFVIDISPETSVQRRSKGRDRHEQDLDLLRSTREEYLKIARGQNNTFVIDGEQPIEAIHQQIREVVTNLK